MPKAATGISGLDEITGGGLPRGRPTLVCGGAGSGKTLLAIEFLVRGATQFDEPGVLMTFEESVEDLAADVASLGFDLPALIARKKIVVDYIRLDRHEIEETGDYDLGGLFIRLDHAIKSVRAKRVVLDTIESLFAGFANVGILRMELARLFRWLKDRRVTAVITGERGEGTLTRHGLEEYVSDAVILLDHRADGQTQRSPRRQVASTKCAARLDLPVPPAPDREDTASTIEALAAKHRIEGAKPAGDAIKGGLVLEAQRGDGEHAESVPVDQEGVLVGAVAGAYFLFEESPSQFMRNMRSIGLGLQAWVKSDRLHFHAARPALIGLEQRLVTMHREIDRAKPAVVVVDPVNELMSLGTPAAVKATLLRLIDYLKTSQTTALFASLTAGDAHEHTTDTGISSLMDTWLLVRTLEEGGQRNRGLYVLKSRGMAHSNQIASFLITDRGVQLGARSPRHRTEKRRSR